MFSRLAGCSLRLAWLKPRNMGMALLMPLAISAFGGDASRASGYRHCVHGPGDPPETGLQGDVPLAARTGPGGFQGF